MITAQVGALDQVDGSIRYKVGLRKGVKFTVQADTSSGQIQVSAEGDVAAGVYVCVLQLA